MLDRLRHAWQPAETEAAAGNDRLTQHVTTETAKSARAAAAEAREESQSITKITARTKKNVHFASFATSRL